MKVVWTPEAYQDRVDVWDYIALDNPVAATQMDELFSNTAHQLATYPKLGHPGKIAGTHELVLHENYRLIYEIEDDVVWILALVHTARQWPPARSN